MLNHPHRPCRFSNLHCSQASGGAGERRGSGCRHDPAWTVACPVLCPGVRTELPRPDAELYTFLQKQRVARNASAPRSRPGTTFATGHWGISWLADSGRWGGPVSLLSHPDIPRLRVLQLPSAAQHHAAQRRFSPSGHSRWPAKHQLQSRAIRAATHELWPSYNRRGRGRICAAARTRKAKPGTQDWSKN